MKFVVFHLNSMENISIYIHIPFCLKKCHYCDFYSITADETMMEAYVDSLILEIERRASLLGGKRLHVMSIFLGGGTPSLLPVNAIFRIMTAIYGSFTVSSDSENSIEINPETVTPAKYRDFLASGINRFSIGIQSFSDSDLKVLGRIHDSSRGIRAISNAVDSGGENVSIDLIYGIPGQTLEDWLENLNIGADRDLQHLSIYGLTIEPGTRFAEMITNHTVVAAGEDLERDMYLGTMEYLATRGYDQYEISNYSMPGYACRHNMRYWDGEPYLGFGASAHSFRNNERSWNVDDVELFIDRMKHGELAVSASETLSQEQQHIEYTMLGLRKTSGFSLSDFKRKFGYDFLDRYKETLIFLQQNENPYITVENDRVHLTEEGLVLYNEICGYFT
ncbi:radical SAM family heme chaperone HemW [candidate division KSB1 bacterium]|nr:radical SAM family heme chaperone HemW [candidate division KSB1 bacterium]